MFQCNQFKTTLWLAVCILTILVSGCSIAKNPEQAIHFPSPAKEPGMILDWGQDVKHQALQLIDSSQHQCYLDVYELSDTDIIHALDHAHRRGVDVRVVLDAKEQHSQSVGFPALKQAAVPVRILSVKEGISHIKMLCVDGHVLIGGMNFGSHSWLNNDASVYIEHPNMSFKSLFLWDYVRANGVPEAAPAAIAPLIYDRDIAQHVVSAIQNARRSIAMEAFDLTDRSVVSALKLANQRGVTVEVLLDPTQSYNRKTAIALRNSGITVRFYRPYQTEFMHAKIVDIDHGQTFIIGSANFSHQAYTYNHEGDIELHRVPVFAMSFENDLFTQIARGTDYPASKRPADW